jgi:hypothetical protein
MTRAVPLVVFLLAMQLPLKYPEPVRIPWSKSTSA